MKNISAWALLGASLCCFTTDAGRLWVSVGAVFLSLMSVLITEGVVNV